tara:strand:+ start:6172 stop:6903 length:732 start_codon:yes stop_codon:yes gene_type:complete
MEEESEEPITFHDQLRKSIQRKLDRGDDHTSYATNPPGVKLKGFHYLRSNPMGYYVLSRFVRLLVIGVAILTAIWFFLLPKFGFIGGLGFGITIFVFIQVLRSRLWILFNFPKVQARKFQNAALTPGLIVSLKPLRVAAMTSLANSSLAQTEGLATKLIESPMLPKTPKKIGQRVPCVSQFSESKEPGYWGGFDSEPIAWATNSRKEIQRCEEKIGDAEFDQLKQLVDEGKIPEKAFEVMRIN